MTRRSDRRTSDLRFSAPHPVKSLRPLLVRRDAVTWTRKPLSDGSVAFHGECPCGGRLVTGYERLKPMAMVCPRCSKWHRLP